MERPFTVYKCLVICVLVVIVVITLCCSSAKAQELSCCKNATGSCRSVCEKMSLVDMATSSSYLENSITEVKKYCAIELVSFWGCLNSTLDDIQRGQQWSGRGCCALPQGARCRHACVTARARGDLAGACRHSDELQFYACLERRDAGDACCAGARDAECRVACTAVFHHAHHSPGREARDKVRTACADSEKVLQCVREHVELTPVANPKKQLHCCDKTDISKCRETCRTVLKSKTTYQEIVDLLVVGGCGPPLPHDKLWQCFLSSDNLDSSSSNIGGSVIGGGDMVASRIDRLGLDAAKLQCCGRAATPLCQKLCSRTFGNDWATLWYDFDQQCLSQPSEENLRICINEVEEPCELGCDGLSYCTNFNNRPTELFRACNKYADDAARFDVALWEQQGNLSVLAVPVRNISRCSPAAWKAVACALQIQPCSRRGHANRICRDDCLDLLSRCVDWPRAAEHTAASLCNRLSPDDPDTPCVSLQPYLEPSDYPRYRSPQESVTAPCKGDVCSTNEVCTVNRHCTGKGCLPYTCTKGCRLGEASPFLVPEGAHVRVPATNGRSGCLKVCRCGSNGVLQHCQPLPCVALDGCALGRRRIAHRTAFLMDCNVCGCYAAEIVCSKRQCEPTAPMADPSFTTLPCNCPPHHVPVCGRNGKLYPNSCLAKCAGLSDSDFEFGQCKDPCENAKCNPEEKCVPDPKVCLSLLHKPCLQYECVNISTNQCMSQPQRPVCDTQNREYPSACFIRKFDGVSLAHIGLCPSGCDPTSGIVCGSNGITYSSECTAWADMTNVDYLGPCLAVGLIGDRPTKRCSQIQCPPLPDPLCIGYTPPGACCPVCGGAIKLIYSRKQIDRAIYALKGKNMDTLSLQAILKALEKQIQIRECVLRGFLSIELDIFVMVQSSLKNPSSLQLEACVREAEKIASLVSRHSPRVTTDLSLSALTAATVVHSSIVNVSWKIGYNIYILLICLIGLKVAR